MGIHGSSLTPRRAAAVARLASPIILGLVVAVPAAPQDLTRYERMARDVLEEMVAINTTHGGGSTTALAEAARRRLLAAGYPPSDVLIIEPTARYGNLVAWLRGRDSELKPLVLLAHIDVVEVDSAEWSTPPFQLIEKDGHFWGRGTADNKDEAAIHIVNLIRLRVEDFRPERDVVVVLTAGEESGQHNGVEWLLENRRELVDGWLVLNEGGGGVLDGEGRPVANTVQLAEKTYQEFLFRASNPGGHSARPRPDNAIADLARALVRLDPHRFPIRLDPLTRRYLERAAPQFEPAVAAAMRALLANSADTAAATLIESRDPRLNATLRTTCVPTLVRGGHAANALAQSAEATINCRLLPDDDPDEVHQALRLIAGVDVEVVAAGYAARTPASPILPAIFDSIESITEVMWPGVPVVPIMGTGATDGSRFRASGIPVHGVSGLFYGDTNNHGANENVPVQSFYDGLEFLYRLTKALTRLPE